MIQGMHQLHSLRIVHTCQLLFHSFLVTFSVTFRPVPSYTLVSRDLYSVKVDKIKINNCKPSR